MLVDIIEGFCFKGLFNFPYCEECKCVPAGVRNDFPGCGRHNIPGVLCLCKQNVEGRQCDRCKEGFWNMKANNPLGKKKTNILFLLNKNFSF